MRAPLLAVLLALLVPATAQAQFDVPAFSVTPSSLQAGSHPDVTIHAEFTPYSLADPPEHVRNLTISLPAGLVGDPTSKPRCSQAAFQADTCPAASRVGTTSVRTVIPPLQIVPITATGDVYNVVPGAGEPARLGVVVRPPLGASKVFIPSPARIRPSDGGLDSVISDMPATVGLPLLGQVEMFIEAMDLTLAAPFVSLPTSCKPAQARIAAVSGAGTAVSRAAAPFTPTGCDKVPFAPRLEATIDSTRMPGLRTVITVPRGHASTAAAAVTLPRAVAVNVAALNDVCTLDEQAAGPCPARARVGSAEARTPLLAQPLAGPVTLAALAGQPLPGLRMDLSGAAALTLAGTVELSPIRTTFAGIPDVPLERFELTFDRNRTLATRGDLCRGPEPRLIAELTGHNGATARLDEPLTVTGCEKPAARLTVNGRRLRLHVEALRGRPLRRVQLALPRGVRLKRGAVARADGRRLRRVRGRKVAVRPGAARHFAIAGTLNRRLRERAVALETLDSTGRVVRQRLRAR
jgi:hypothetical protein